MKKNLLAFVLFVVAAAVVSLLGLFSIAPRIDWGQLGGAASLLCVAGVGTLLSYRVQGSASGTVSFIPYLVAVAVFPNWTTVALSGLAASLGEMVRPKSPVKRAFNVAQTVVSLSAAVAVFRATGGLPIQVDSSFHIVPHTLLVSAFLLVNTSLVAVAISIADDRPFLRTWVEGNLVGLPYDIAAIAVVYGFARAFADWGGFGVLTLGIFVIGVKFTYQHRYQLETTNRELLELFVQTVEYRDPYTSGHSQRVSRNSRIIAAICGLTPKEIERVATAALLHDVGKIHEVFAPILMKPGRLTPEEREIMQLHPVKSAELVEKISDLKDIVPAVRHHHENWDGTGYPDGLKGRDIPLASRIIMFADTIDAMTTDRPYRKAMGIHEVKAELLRWRGKQFDPQICDALVASTDFERIFDSADSGDHLVIGRILDGFRNRYKIAAVA